MTEREKQLLLAIITEHIRHSRPVGSKVIVEKYLKDISSATIRNDMIELERVGLIEQPHTSAGRIPTTKAYEYYVANFLPERELDKTEQQKLQRILSAHRGQYGLVIRELAKAVADLSSVAVIVGFAPRDSYYTGLSNLFRQPEFAEIDLIQNFSQIVDHLDEVMEEIFPRIRPRVEILLGKHNPFGQTCGVLLTKYGGGKIPAGMFGILGPIRMPYERHRALLEYTRNLLSK
ncbi:MAG: hypothetical protein PHH01_03730 [Patescibacteria group bacterium]|nr:hypothetical protein [Patescibacteria group bacterium]